MHNILYWDYPENIKRSSVLEDARRIAESDGDGTYMPSQLKWHDEVKPLDDRETAYAWIVAHDKGFYDDHAVRYYDYSKAKDTKKIIEYREKIKSYQDAKKEYESEHSVRKQKAEFIGCKNCGSKIAKKYLYGESCPVCRKELRSEYIIEKIKWYEGKIKELWDKINEEQKKQKSAGAVKWLIKIEYHS